MAKLSVPCSNNNISKRARRKVFPQLQVNIVRIVEEEEPISVGLASKPMQTCIHCLFGFYWRNGLEIRSKSLFSRGVNVEDVGEANNNILSKIAVISVLFDQLAYRLPLDSSTNLNASWLFPAPPRPYNTKMRWDLESESKYTRILLRMSFRPINEATGGGHSLCSVCVLADSWRGPGEAG